MRVVVVVVVVVGWLVGRLVVVHGGGGGGGISLFGTVAGDENLGLELGVRNSTWSTWTPHVDQSPHLDQSRALKLCQCHNQDPPLVSFGTALISRALGEVSYIRKNFACFRLVFR